MRERKTDCAGRAWTAVVRPMLRFMGYESDRINVIINSFILMADPETVGPVSGRQHSPGA